MRNKPFFIFFRNSILGTITSVNLIVLENKITIVGPGKAPTKLTWWWRLYKEQKRYNTIMFAYPGDTTKIA